ncbi:hypothetical protein GF377_07280, partial [candidate division GN15 bacterium]|nr:hypothetical protein [candidate division GN15 bacterium]
MNGVSEPVAASSLPAFGRRFLDGEDSITRIGEGAIGGKAAGLVHADRIIRERFSDGRAFGLEIGVPRMLVIATDVFDDFVEQNDLRRLAETDESDEQIAEAFLQAAIPADIVGDLRSLINGVRQPLAVRSSSMLEDSLSQPFAGVYATKMIPNNQPSADQRFRLLTDAIKLVWASTYLSPARHYAAATGHKPADEKMAVIIQEVVGERFDERFYPVVSGVARSYNFYPTGRMKPQDGVVNLALGLGKTIVDGEVSWPYCPRYPQLAPPSTVRELIDRAQQKYWAVNMGKPPAFDPIAEAEYLVQTDLKAADMDDTLYLVASTYDPANDRLVLGTTAAGPRVVNFARLTQLGEPPVNDVIASMLEVCEDALGEQVEIEFAVTIDTNRPTRARFGFLQLRPMMVSTEAITISDEELNSTEALAVSERALGNGAIDSIQDIVYVNPDTFDKKYTTQIAGELAEINKSLHADDTPYVLIGFGRWGSSDPWLGIP